MTPVKELLCIVIEYYDRHKINFCLAVHIQQFENAEYCGDVSHPRLATALLNAQTSELC